MNQNKLYNLNPKSYFNIWESQKIFKINASSFKKSLKKALSGNYKGILLDEPFLYNKNLIFYINEALKEGLQPVLQVTSKRFKDKKLDLEVISKVYNALILNINSSTANPSSFNTIFDETDSPYYKDVQPFLFQERFLKQKLLQKVRLSKTPLIFNVIFDEIKSLPFKDMQNFLDQMFFTYIITKNNYKTPFQKKLPREYLERTEFYFPYKKSFFDPFLTPRQVYKFIKQQDSAKNKYKNLTITELDSTIIEFNSSKAIQACQSEVYDSRIPEDMELEPITQPFAVNQISQSSKEIYFSVVIPSYNNKTQLINTLKYLAGQNYPKAEYEIIVVDDGSSDNTKQEITKFMQQQPGVNFKAIYFPRVVEKKAGEARFRAGIARNLGVKHSKGKILAFLDADILTPPDYLKRLKAEHEKADVILLKRYHLKHKTPIKDMSFNHEKLKKWYSIEEKNYWGPFYEKGFDKVQTPWKYICTYGLSLSKKDFQSVGAFGKNFVFYGFEDTDLGYRLFKKNKKFLLSDIKVYHQAPPKEQSMRLQNPLFRQRQLSKTAKIFFYRHLDPKIYEELKSYMIQERNFYYFFPFLKNKNYSSIQT